MLHGSELVARLIAERRIRLENPIAESITFHDPCYLGRYNGVYDAPRDILEAIPGLTLKELPRSRERGLCCGAGGGRMWMEEKTGTRINQTRMQEIAEAKTDSVGVSCPFCMVMIGNAKEELAVSTTPFDVLELARRSMVVGARPKEAPALTAGRAAPPLHNGPSRRNERMRPSRNLGILFLVGAGALSACRSRGVPPPQPGGPAGGTGNTESRRDAFREAVDSLHKQINAPRETIVGISQDEVTWNDSCLGCAKTGESCTQVPEPGIPDHAPRGRCDLRVPHGPGRQERAPLRPVSVRRIAPGGMATPSSPVSAPSSGAYPTPTPYVP